MQFFHHSKKDIRSLTIFYKICTAFAVIPCGTFDKTTAKSGTLKKLQGLLLLIFITVGTSYSMYVRHVSYGKIYTTSHMVLDTIDEFFIVMLAFTVIFKSCFYSKESWIKLNNNLQHIDEILKNKGLKERNIFLNVSVQFFIYISLYMCGEIFWMSTWVQKMGIVAVKAYAMNHFCYIYDVLSHFLIYAIASGFKCRYNDVNKLLENEGSDYWEKKVLVSLRKIGNISECLTETVDLFNEIFGWPLIFIAGKSVAQLLMCLNFLLTNIQIDDTTLKIKLYVASFAMVIYTLMSVSFVMVSSDSATAASKKTTSLCYKLQEQYLTKSEARMELFRLAQQTSANTAIITAANYFQINKATLFSLFGATTTYFIVVLQFNQSLIGQL